MSGATGPGGVPRMPVVARDLPRGPVLVIAPHPDDEIMGPGATLLAHVRQGDPVSVVVVFDGAQGDPDGRYDRASYVARRQEETRLVARRHFRSEDVVFHGFADGLAESDLDLVYPGLPPEPEAKLRVLLDGLATHLLGHLERVRPRVVYYPWSGEFHADHWAVATAFENLRRNEPARFAGVDCLGYEVWSTLLPETLVDVSETFEEKLEAMRLYESQTAYVDYPGLIGGLNRHRGFLMPHASAPAERRRAEAFVGTYRAEGEAR
ncbi:MAG: PIG-L deacetylase family protein [Planctomycetota bacterium]